MSALVSSLPVDEDKPCALACVGALIKYMEVCMCGWFMGNAFC